MHKTLTVLRYETRENAKPNQIKERKKRNERQEYNSGKIAKKKKIFKRI